MAVRTSVQKVRLLGEPRDVMVARTFLRRALKERHLDDHGDDAELVLSELVTRSIVNGRGPVDVVITIDGDAVHLQVSDQDPTFPVVTQADESWREDRAVSIIDALAEWSVEQSGMGKTVTARVPLH